jgi:hypothetical protein
MPQPSFALPPNMPVVFEEVKEAITEDDTALLQRNHTMEISLTEQERNEQIARLLQMGVEERDAKEAKATDKKNSTDGMNVVHHQATRFAQQHQSGVVEQSFPWLFFWGRGGPSEVRQNKTSLSSLLEHYARLSTRSFQDYEWALHAYNFKARQQMFQKGFVQGNIRVNGQKRSEQWGEMTKAETLAAINHYKAAAQAAKRGARAPPLPTTFTPEGLAFMRSLDYCVGEASHTKEHIEQNRTKLFSYMARFGTPQLWYALSFVAPSARSGPLSLHSVIRITISPDDLMTINIYILATGETPETCPEAKIRYKVLAEQPGAASLSFEKLLYVFQRFILGWDVDAKRPLR